MAGSDGDNDNEQQCKENCKKSGFVLYRNRADWSDVKPIPQDDGPNPVVAINYSDQFKDVYDYFRAILKSKEKSERALTLTEDALGLNTANYTVWQYRREILKELNKDLSKELDFVGNMIEVHPKNYQVWHHRKVIVEWKNDPSLELEFTAKILNYDSKNYHAWQHRQWVLDHFNLFDGEINYIEELIQKDIRNNSAWNQRYFIISKTTGFTEQILEKEIEYACAQISHTTHNESAWNYLRGILQHYPKTLDSHEGVKGFIEELYSNGNRSPYLIAFLVDMLFIRLKEYQDQSIINRISQLCDSLAVDIDPTRAQYWWFLKRQLHNEHGPEQN